MENLRQMTNIILSGSKQLANFLNLLDAQGKLSITNVAVIVCLLKLAFAPAASITEAGTLLVALANYAHKRYTNVAPEPVEADQELQKKLDEMQSTVSNLALKAGLKL